MPRTRCPALMVVLLLAMTAACAQVPPAVPQPAPQGQADAVRRALEDAAARLGVAVASLQQPRVERVTWRDGSLGCPEAGLMYPQVLVPGYRIMVDSGASSLEYHAGARGQFLYCPPGRAVAPLPASPAR